MQIMLRGVLGFGLLLSSLGFSQSEPERLPCAKVDMVLVFDRSGSLNNTVAQTLIDTAVDAFTTTYLVNKENLQIGVTTFTDNDPNDTSLNAEAREKARKAMPLIEITSYPNALIAATKNLPSAGGGTNIYLGLRSAKEMFQRHLIANPDRVDAKKIVILFSDGISQSESKDIEEAQALVSGSWSQGLLPGDPQLSIPVILHGIIAPEIKTTYDKVYIPTGVTQWVWEGEYFLWPHYRILEKKKTGKKLHRKRPKNEAPNRPWTDPDNLPNPNELEEYDEVMMHIEELREVRTEKSTMAYDLDHLQALVSPDGFLLLLDYATLIEDLRRLSRCF